MFKWVWRFFCQKNSLWVKEVKALHGEDGKIGKKVQPSFITPKLGNGDNTSFWDVAWCGDIAFKNLVPRLYALESMKNIDVVSKFSHGGRSIPLKIGVNGSHPSGSRPKYTHHRNKKHTQSVVLTTDITMVAAETLARDPTVVTWLEGVAASIDVMVTCNWIIRVSRGCVWDVTKKLTQAL
nr:hypothetical protein [Tanacetum cinerariifolium]